jgi:hypothetical protein
MAFGDLSLHVATRGGDKEGGVVAHDLLRRMIFSFNSFMYDLYV